MQNSSLKSASSACGSLMRVAAVVGGSSEGVERRMVDITRDKPIKVAVRVQVPVRDHPKFNFVGKLLGPKGNSLKRLQEESGCKMAVLGRGSMKDRQKEEELRASGDPKFSHLNEDLHVEISAYATPAEAHARIAYALVEVRRFLVPDYNDDIRQEQMWEMQMISCTETNSEAPLSSPETPPEPNNSPISSTTQVADTPEPSAKPNVGRKRPLVPASRPAMSPTKRTVMSLLARARAVQNKEPQTVIGLQNTLAMLAQPPEQTATPQVPRIQLIGSSVCPPTVRRHQTIMSASHSHQILAPAIHGLIHTQFNNVSGVF